MPQWSLGGDDHMHSWHKQQQSLMNWLLCCIPLRALIQKNKPRVVWNLHLHSLCLLHFTIFHSPHFERMSYCTWMKRIWFMRQGYLQVWIFLEELGAFGSNMIKVTITLIMVVSTHFRVVPKPAPDSIKHIHPNFTKILDDMFRLRIAVPVSSYIFFWDLERKYLQWLSWICLTTSNTIMLLATIQVQNGHCLISRCWRTGLWESSITDRKFSATDELGSSSPTFLLRRKHTRRGHLWSLQQYVQILYGN